MPLPLGEFRSLANKASLLRKAGYEAADNDSTVTIASIFNAGIFARGGVLVGSHAFGAILNNLGVRPAKNYVTTDFDIGAARISVGLTDERGLLEVLRDSGLRFLEVPEFDHRKPSTSFKVKGKPLKVDLLVDGTMKYESLPVPSLKAWATGLPFFGYLVGEQVLGVVIGRDHVVPVRLPHPARFALHKLIVSTLRVATSAAKSEKDILQSVTVIETLLDRAPQDLEDAAAHLDASARPRVATAAKRALNHPQRYPVNEQTHDYLEALAAQA